MKRGRYFTELAAFRSRASSKVQEVRRHGTEVGQLTKLLNMLRILVRSVTSTGEYDSK